MKRFTTLASAMGLAIALAACGSDADPAPSEASAPAETTAAPVSTTAPAATAAPDTTEPATAASDDGAATTLGLAETDLGSVLVDAEGFALYLFVPDSQGPSTCEGQCRATWPQLVGEPAPGDGVDAGLLGTVENADGSIQATYNGWPLYYFASDAAPGDLNGQGVGDVWYLVDPVGDAVTTSATSEADTDSGSDDLNEPGY